MTIPFNATTCRALSKGPHQQGLKIFFYPRSQRNRDYVISYVLDAVSQWDLCLRVALTLLQRLPPRVNRGIT